MAPTTSTDGKYCPRCQAVKPFTAFYRNRSKADGYQDNCKACFTEANSRSRQKHIDARLATGRLTARRRREAEPEAVRAAQQRWYATHGAAYQRTWQAEHREQGIARAQRRRDADPIRAAYESNAARVKRLGAPGSHTLEEWAALCAQYGNRCACCGEAHKLGHDHIIPLALGGTDNFDNVQPLCRRCNIRKGRRATDYRHP